MIVKMKIQEVNYGDVVVQALPVVSSKITGDDRAIYKIVSAISNLPEKTLRLIFDAVGQSEKNEIISLLVQENKEKNSAVQ